MNKKMNQCVTGLLLHAVLYVISYMLYIESFFDQISSLRGCRRPTACRKKEKNSVERVNWRSWTQEKHSTIQQYDRINPVSIIIDRFELRILHGNASVLYPIHVNPPCQCIWRPSGQHLYWPLLQCLWPLDYCRYEHKYSLRMFHQGKYFWKTIADI